MDSGKNLLSLLQRDKREASSTAGEEILRLVRSSPPPPGDALTRLALPGADVRYMRSFLEEEEARRLFEQLRVHKQRHKDEWTRMSASGREIAQWSQPGGRRYAFSDCEFVASEFPDFVLRVKQRVEERLRQVYMQNGDRKLELVFNYCVANFYVDQNCGVNWHSDAEIELVDEAPIVCVSVGAQRNLGLRHKRTMEETHITLHHGSLFVMAGLTQTHYLHSILRDDVPSEMPRFSLTFRIHHKAPCHRIPTPS